MASDYFYFSDHRFHLQAFKTFLYPYHRGFYINYHAHKRYPFLNSIYKLSPNINQNTKKKECLENSFITSITNFPDYHSSNLAEYTKCIEALLVNSTLNAIIAADIIIDNMLSMRSNFPVLCFARNDTLFSLFSIYLVAHKLRQLNIRFKLIDLVDNLSIKSENSLSFLYTIMHQALLPDEELVDKIFLSTKQYGYALITNSVKKNVLHSFDSKSHIFIQKDKSNIRNLTLDAYNTTRDANLAEQLHSERFAFIKYLSKSLIESMLKISSKYSPFTNANLFLACAPIIHTPATLILGRLLFSRIHLLLHSDIPSYEIPCQMFDFQVVTKRSSVISDACGQDISFLKSKEVLLNEI